MEEDGIILSKKWGLNPSIETCIICKKDMGLVLFGELKGDVQAPKKCMLGHLCEECVKAMDENEERIFIEIRNDIPTGTYCLMPDYCLNPEVLNDLGDRRLVYVSPATIADMDKAIKELEIETVEKSLKEKKQHNRCLK